MRGVKYDSIINGIAPYLLICTYGHSFVIGTEPAYRYSFQLEW